MNPTFHWMIPIFVNKEDKHIVTSTANKYTEEQQNQIRVDVKFP